MFPGEPPMDGPGHPVFRPVSGVRPADLDRLTSLKTVFL